MATQPGVDRHMKVQERIRQSKQAQRGSGWKKGGTPPPTPTYYPQKAEAFGTKYPQLGTAASAAFRSVGQPGPRRPAGPGIGGAVNTDLGSQLSRRVDAGVLDADQAKRVAGERALLEQKFGPDFREKVFGDTGAFQKARTQLAANPQSDRLKALVEQLMAKRKAAVSQASFSRDRNQAKKWGSA